MARVLELDHMSNLASQLATIHKRLDGFEKLNVNSIQTNIECGNYAGEQTNLENALWE